jgi:hypothetical protein
MNDQVLAEQLYMQQLEDLWFLYNFDALFDRYSEQELPRIAFQITCGRIFDDYNKIF